MLSRITLEFESHNGGSFVASVPSIIMFYISDVGSPARQEISVVSDVVSAFGEFADSSLGAEKWLIATFDNP